MADRPSSSSRALSAPNHSDRFGCFYVVPGGLFLAVGLGTAYFFTFLPVWGMVRAKSWVETPCRILSSQLEADDEGSSRISIDYSYSFNQRDYRSKQYCFMSGNSNTSRGWKSKVIADHPPGKQTKCFVNPNDPDEAVIERGWVSEMWWGLFPIPFLLVGLGVLLAPTGIFRRRPPVTTNSPQLDSNEVQYQQRPQSISHTGPITLKPESTRTGVIGATISLVFAIFCIWNLRVFLLTFRRNAAANNEFFVWFPTLMMVPFVLLGIGSFLYALYNILSLINPRPELIVNSDAILLGGEFVLNWSLNRRSGSIRKFRISLKGIERVTYQRGTTTTTDTSTFVETNVFESTEPLNFDQGSAKVVIPADSMHSFDAKNNKIVWTLEVYGDIPWWPNIKTSFPIVVLPKASP